MFFPLWRCWSGQRPSHFCLLNPPGRAARPWRGVRGTNGCSFKRITVQEGPNRLRWFTKPALGRPPKPFSLLGASTPPVRRFRCGADDAPTSMPRRRELLPLVYSMDEARVARRRGFPWSAAQSLVAGWAALRPWRSWRRRWVEQGGSERAGGLRFRDMIFDITKDDNEEIHHSRVMNNTETPEFARFATYYPLCRCFLFTVHTLLQHLTNQIQRTQDPCKLHPSQRCVTRAVHPNTSPPARGTSCDHPPMPRSRRTGHDGDSAAGAATGTVGEVSSMEDFDRRFPACGGFLPWRPGPRTRGGRRGVRRHRSRVA